MLVDGQRFVLDQRLEQGTSVTGLMVGLTNLGKDTFAPGTRGHANGGSTRVLYVLMTTVSIIGIVCRAVGLTQLQVGASVVCVTLHTISGSYQSLTFGYQLGNTTCGSQPINESVLAASGVKVHLRVSGYSDLLALTIGAWGLHLLVYDTSELGSVKVGSAKVNTGLTILRGVTAARKGTLHLDPHGQGDYQHRVFGYRGYDVNGAAGWGLCMRLQTVTVLLHRLQYTGH